MSHLNLVGPCDKCHVQVSPAQDHKSWCDRILDEAVNRAMQGHTVQFGNPADGTDDLVCIQPAG